MNYLLFETDIFAKSFFICLGLVLIFLVFWWFYSIIKLVEPFLKRATELTNGTLHKKNRLPPFYAPDEVKGLYHGREVTIGIIYSGLRNEFIPLPAIRMRLKETLGYNANRLPEYAVIEKNWLVYKVKLSILWGVFDRNFTQAYNLNNLGVVLAKLLATAEDVERGRTLKEFFR